MTSKRTLATLYGIGLAPFAPGTWGSIAAAVLALPVLWLPYGGVLLALGVVASTILGTTSATRYMRDHNCPHDPGEIVVDELAGQWLTYGVAFLALELDAGAAMPHPLFAAAMGLGLFRLFDILKPWPISLADRTVKGGFGVMFDDLLAAIPAGILLAGAVMVA